VTPFTAAAMAELVVVIFIIIAAAIIVNMDAIFYALGALGR
jgi:preprotein translocase subunit SecE